MIEAELCLFNPDNDLALANDEENYMPPASARQMVTDLAILPMWYATEGAAVLAPSAYNLAFLKEMQSLFSLPVTLMTEAEDFSQVQSIAPWGWNVALRKRLSALGVSEAQLPAFERLERLRRLSHRSQAVHLLPHLRLNRFFCGESFYLTELSDCRTFVESGGPCLLKAPLSGSGKGLNWCKGAFTSPIENWCARLIGQQEGVVGEPVYQKVEDFAMEFRADGRGEICFAGYSLFRTGGSGAYEGNLLLPDREIEKQLSAYVPVEALHLLRVHLEKALPSRLGTSYAGYLGVDMMICRFDTGVEFRIHPCVEINLRMNMGVVARLLSDRYVSAGSSGSFQISYHSVQGEALAVHERMKEESTLLIAEGRAVSGYLPLTPVAKQTKYRAWALLSSER